MNQELYEQLLNGAAVLVRAQKDAERIKAVQDKKRSAQCELNEEFSQISVKPKVSRSLMGSGIPLTIIGGYCFIIFLVASGVEMGLAGVAIAFIIGLLPMLGGIAMLVLSGVTRRKSRADRQEQYDRHVIECEAYKRRLDPRNPDS